MEIALGRGELWSWGTPTRGCTAQDLALSHSYGVGNGKKLLAMQAMWAGYHPLPSPLSPLLSGSSCVAVPSLFSNQAVFGNCV